METPRGEVYPLPPNIHHEGDRLPGFSTCPEGPGTESCPEGLSSLLPALLRGHGVSVCRAAPWELGSPSRGGPLPPVLSRWVQPQN